MTDFIYKDCPKCSQKLRFPKKIGGMLMACPTCGKKFYSDFRLAGTAGSGPREFISTLFDAPSRILDRIGRFFSA